MTTNPNTPLNLGPAQTSLLLPLWARAKETEKSHLLIRDTHAKSLLEKIDYDFTKIEKNPEFAQNQQFQWALRAYCFDEVVKAFLRDKTDAVAVNLGAGLDTAFQRVDEVKLAASYPLAQLVFDTLTSAWIVWLINWAIMSKSGLDPSVRIKWHLAKARSLRRWVRGIRVLEERSMFLKVPSTQGLSRKVLRDLKIANFLRV